MLTHYEESLEQVLYEGVPALEELSAERAAELTSTGERAASKLCAEDGMRVEVAQEKYLSALSVQHDLWFKRESDLADAHVAARKFELEIVDRHLAEHGRALLEEQLSGRCEQHLALLTLVLNQTLRIVSFRPRRPAQSGRRRCARPSSWR